MSECEKALQWLDSLHETDDMSGAVTQYKWPVAQHAARAIRARLAELEAEKAELVKDRERLDWLNERRQDLVAQGQHIQVELHGHGWAVYGQCETIRQAIDTAREGE